MTERYVFGRVRARLKKLQCIVDTSRELGDKSFKPRCRLHRGPVDTTLTESFRNDIMKSDMVGQFGVLHGR